MGKVWSTQASFQRNCIFHDRDAALENVRREGLGAGMADLPDQSTPAGSVGQGQ